MSAEVIDPRTLAPLDTATILASVGDGPAHVVVDQSTRHGSAAAVIAAEVASEGFSSLKAPIKLVTALDATIPYSQPMEEYLLPGRGEDRRRRCSRCSARHRSPSEPWPAARPLGSSAASASSSCRTMWLIRAFEERVGGLVRANEVHGLVHLSIGQEAVAAGVCGLLRVDDPVYSGHRAHGHALAKGAPPGRVLAELMGRADGLCRGLGGSMHLVDVEHGFRGATGVVGGNVPLALGSALAARLLGGDQVAVVFFGDGAVQNGLFAESVNLAALWRLPAILVCENNGFAEFTPREAHTTVERVSDVVAPYGLERETVDGSDALAVRAAFARFLETARRGGGRFSSSASLTACAATTRATRSATARHSQPRTGRSSTRSCVCSGAESPRAGSSATRRRASSGRLATRSRRRCASRARARSLRRSLTAELVYAR